MLRNTDVLVVGGGIIGASIAYHLSCAGFGRVTLCEQDRFPGPGATAKSGGLIRMHHTNPWQATLAWQSYPIYAEWADAVGGDCGFRAIGFVMVVGPEHRRALGHNVRALRRLGIPTRMLEPEELAELQPPCRIEGIGAAAYEPFSGYANPALAALAFVQRARDRGLVALEGVRVTSIVCREGRVTGVESNLGRIGTGTIVLASSFWATRLAEEIGLVIPVRPKQVAIGFLSWAPPRGALPLCAYIDDTVGTYFRPEPGGSLLVGVGEKDCDAAIAPPISEQDVLDARARVGVRLPLARDAVAVGGRSACDGYTPDNHPILGPVDGVRGLYLAVGFSGAGFKVAPAVGRAVAAELASGAEVAELARFRLRRFETGDLIRAEHGYAHS